MSLAYCQTTPKNGELKLIKSIQLSISETSGLTSKNNSLFTVGDESKKVFELSFEGELLKTYPIGVSGFEGITFDDDKNLFYLVNEDKRKLYEFSLEAGVLNSIKIKGKQKNGSNKGLEGVCYQSEEKRLYLVNEAGPKQLLKISSKNKKVTKTYDLKFGDDISGICYDKKRNVFWVLSDESKAVYKTSLSGKLLKKYSIPVTKPEGITLNSECDKLYVVSDATSELFVFEL